MQNYENETCAICLEEKGCEKWAVTRCGHGFHSGCLSRIRGTLCPLCRRELVDAALTEEFLRLSSIDIREIGNSLHIHFNHQPRVHSIEPSGSVNFSRMESVYASFQFYRVEGSDRMRFNHPITDILRTADPLQQIII